MIVLSRQNVNDSRPPATSAELMSGSVIWRKARAGRRTEVGGRLFERLVETRKTGPHDQRDHGRGVQRLADPQPQHAAVDRPRSLLNGPPIAFDEPAEQRDGVHDLWRHEDQEQHDHERLAPRPGATGERDAGQTAEDHGDDGCTDGCDERVAQRQAETGLVEQVAVPVGASGR